MGFLQDMADQTSPAEPAATAADGSNNHIQIVVQSVKPTINDLLAQDIPREQIKQTINDYYAANPDGVTPEGLHDALMGLSQVEKASPETIAPAAATAPIETAQRFAPAINPENQPAVDAVNKVLQAGGSREDAYKAFVENGGKLNSDKTPVGQTAEIQPSDAAPVRMASAAPIYNHLNDILSQPSPTATDASPQTPLVAAPAAIVPQAPTVAAAAEPPERVAASQQAAGDPIPSHLDAILSASAPADAAQSSPEAVKASKPSDIGYRFATGLQDPVLGIGQAAAHILPTSDGYAAKVDAEVNQREADYRKNHDVEGMDWARLGGNILSPGNALLPLKAISAIEDGGSALMRMAKGAMSGGAMGAAQPTETDQDVGYYGAKTFQTGTGAVTGGALSGIGEGVARTIKPKISDDVQILLDNNIRVGTDQMAGTGGSKLTSVPIVGNLINENHNRALQDLNTAVLNKSLAEIGEKIPPTVQQYGNEALTHTRERLSNAYETLLPTLKGNINDPSTNTLGQRLIGMDPLGNGQPLNFGQKIDALLGEKYYNMHPDTIKKLAKTVKNAIADRIAPDGSFDGKVFKQIETKLNEQISHFQGVPSSDDRMMAAALSDVKALLKDQLSSTSPEGAAELAKINKGYSLFKVAQNAASSTAAPNGVFNPSQLLMAVKNADNSLDHRAFSEGTQPLYDLATAAKNVLSNYKDSGTAGRAIAAAAAGSVATGGIPALLSHPLGTGLGALTAGYYTQPGQAAARFLMTARPEGASALSELVRKATDAASLSPYAK